MFWRYSCLKILWPWYDLRRSLKVKGHDGKWKFTYDFLSVVNSNYMARKHRFEDTDVWKCLDLDLTFQGHQRSKVMRGIESSHMTSYLLLIVTIRLGSMVLKTQAEMWFSRHFERVFQDYSFEIGLTEEGLSVPKILKKMWFSWWSTPPSDHVINQILLNNNRVHPCSGIFHSRRFENEI